MTYTDLHKQLAETYYAKNRAYGNSFDKNCVKYGLVAGLIPIANKFDRLEALMRAKTPDNGEPITDTLLDMANYCLMLASMVRYSGGEGLIPFTRD